MHAIDEQFLWGGALLLTPVVTEDTTSVTGYVPEGRCFDYYTVIPQFQLILHIFNEQAGVNNEFS